MDFVIWLYCIHEINVADQSVSVQIKSLYNSVYVFISGNYTHLIKRHLYIVVISISCIMSIEYFKQCNGCKIWAKRSIDLSSFKLLFFLLESVVNNRNLLFIRIFIWFSHISSPYSFYRVITWSYISFSLCYSERRFNSWLSWVVYILTLFL